MKKPPLKVETRGRKPTGRVRTASVPKIKPESYQRLKEIAERKGISIAEVIEQAIGKMPIK